MLPDTLHHLDRADRRGYASLLAHMASSDGEITVEELATFEGRLGNALIAPLSRKDLRLELKRPKPIALAIREMSEESVLLALRDALLLAAADGVYERREKKIIERIASEAGISDQTLNKLYSWVDEGWIWMRKGRDLLGLVTEDEMQRVIHDEDNDDDESDDVEESEEDDSDDGDGEDDDGDDFKEDEYDVFADIEESTQDDGDPAPSSN
jgi:hypothetical protein